MAINPGIALGVESPKPLDLLGAYGNAMSIKGLIDSSRFRDAQMAALGQETRHKAQDQALDLATKKVTIGQKIAAGLMALPPEQRAAQYPVFRQEYMSLTGDSNAPEQYDEAHVGRWAAMGMDPKAMQEAILAERQRMAMAGAQQEARGGTPQRGATGSVADTVATDGSAGLQTPQVNVADYSGVINNPSYHFRVSDLVSRNPLLAGTKMGAEALETALKLKEDQRKGEAHDWAGFNEVTGADGKTYLRRGSDLMNGGNPLNVGQKAPEGFQYIEGKLTPIPEYWSQKEKVAKAGATSLAVYPPGAIEPGKATRTDLEKETMQASSAIQRFNQIQQGFKPEYLQFAPRLSAGWAALREKGGANLAPGDQRFLQEFSAWSRGAIEEVNNYIQQKTGAAMGVQEAQRLTKGVPNPGQGLLDGDSPTQFKAKLDDTMRQLKMVEARSIYALRNGLSLMGPNGEPVVPLSAMPKIMDDRGLQIEQQVRKQFPNLNAKELKQMVVKQLGVEFGIGAD